MGSTISFVCQYLAKHRLALIYNIPYWGTIPYYNWG